MNRKIPSHTERALQEHAALPHLNALVDAGCDRDDILISLEMAFLADESWETQIGMKLRDFKLAIAQVRHCSDTIDRLNRSMLMYRASVEYRIPGFAGLQESPTLAERLREYASMMDSLRNVFGPKRDIGRHAWKAWIVALVTEETKKPHDLEVSSLIAAMLDDSQYSQDAHKTWRRKHLGLIAMVRKTVQDRRLKKIFLSPPWLSK